MLLKPKPLELNSQYTFAEDHSSVKAMKELLNDNNTKSKEPSRNKNRAKTMRLVVPQSRTMKLVENEDRGDTTR